jgi:isochorismate hydrolase
MDGLDRTTGDVLRKSQYDAFYQTGLEERLRFCG